MRRREVGEVGPRLSTEELLEKAAMDFDAITTSGTIKESGYHLVHGLRKLSEALRLMKEQNSVHSRTDTK
jgi:hypothetical protein